MFEHRFRGRPDAAAGVQRPAGDSAGVTCHRAIDQGEERTGVVYCAPAYGGLVVSKFAVLYDQVPSLRDRAAELCPVSNELAVLDRELTGSVEDGTAESGATVPGEFAILNQPIAAVDTS